MGRTLLIAIALATLPLRLFADVVSEDVPLTPPMLALAASLRIDPERQPARLIPDIIRLLHTRSQTREEQILASIRAQTRSSASPTAAATVLVPVPLTADIWSRAIFRRTIAPSDLVSSIVLDRQAALLCYGLSGMDDETLGYLAEHPAILTSLFERDGPAFSAFGESLHIRDSRVVTPGGDAAIPLWESVVGESAQRPDRFIRALFSLNEGRLAYLYDRIAHLDEPHSRFALGLWIANPAVRQERFRALADIVSHDYKEWHVLDLPFSRPLSDFAMLMARLRVEPSGIPSAPSDSAFWTAVFDGGELHDTAPAEGRPLVDAAYLAEAAGTGDIAERGHRIDQVSFGQRVFADITGDGRRDAIAALRAFPTSRMLLWTLERVGIKAPAVYAAAVRQAAQATGGDADATFFTLTELQGTLALIARMKAVGTLNSAAAERLIVSLAAVPIADERKGSSLIAQWVEKELLPVLPPGADVESRLIAGLSGAVDERVDPRIVWEGQQYRVDFSEGERGRLATVRQKQGGYSIDVAFELGRLARTLESRSLTSDTVGRVASSLAELENRFPPKTRETEVEILAPGVRPPRPAREVVDRAMADLSKPGEARDPKRASRVAPALMQAADVVFAESLLSLVYALDIGDPQGTALLASNVALRHDFGLELRDSDQRIRRAWEVPRQDVQPGSPWRVTGSLLGLDIALAPMMLKRVNLDHIADVPQLLSNEREGFAVGAVLMNPRLLHDADRDRIVEAIARGRERVAALKSPQDGSAIADLISLDGWRRRALAWELAHQRPDLASTFTLNELLVIGGGAPGVDLDAWGTSAVYSRGCTCTALVPPGSWSWLAGRPQLAMIATLVSDLNLRLAIALKDLKVPASLERPVLAAATQDFIYEVAPTDAADWWTIVETAQALTRQRIEDYVASAAAVNGPLVPIDDVANADGP